jgi:hypothetical protein
MSAAARQRSAYHVRSLATWRILAETGTRPARGALEHFYVVSEPAVEPVTRLRAAVAVAA